MNGTLASLWSEAYMPHNFKEAGDVAHSLSQVTEAHYFQVMTFIVVLYILYVGWPACTRGRVLQRLLSQGRAPGTSFCGFLFLTSRTTLPPLPPGWRRQLPVVAS